MESRTLPRLQLWAGVECTVNRVGDRYFSQLERSGHWERESDTRLFADLGIRTLRFPILWELLAPNSLDELDWSWTDPRLAQMRDLGIRPIAGLLHHGSGPRFTNLLDPAFPEKFARYARKVAERYPWVDAYTPINEPLTTARFSALYGHWYPHRRDDRSFARALLNQCRATVLAMRAIREVNPSAQLVQTEDFGKTFSTRLLAYQAKFENDRRWVTWDLLSGMVEQSHPMWTYLRWAGIAEPDLEIFRREPCVPDILGVNHYVTSERFLDENIAAHPAESWGGNGRHRYADVAAVRSDATDTAGAKDLLLEIWRRYGRTIAITEAHLGCTVDEQLRWFMEIWDAALRAREEGADVKAVASWALLGSFDWNSLLTREDNYYEAGAFDVFDGDPRPTLLAEMIRELAAGRDFDHPFLSEPGWWRRESRLERRCA
jgi:dTDP-4-dehydrorhamnose reductase